jgi:argininosuccinate lyase
VLVASRLFLKHQLISLTNSTAELAECFLTRGIHDALAPMPGYTHFQRAMPTSFGVWFHSFAESLLQCASDGLKLLDSVDCNPLGAASGFGVPLPLDRSQTASLLGFARVQRNPIAVINSRGKFELAALHWCIQTLAVIEKFAFDVVLYCSEEYGFVTLPASFTTGSSIMPQKRNPDVAELLRARTAAVRGAAQELEWTIGKLPSNYHRDHQYTKEPVSRALAVSSEALSMTVALVKAVEIRPDRAEAVMGAEIFATYEAYRLVASGVPFREAYRQAATSYQGGTLDLPLLRKELATVLAGAQVEMKVCESELTKLRSEVQALENRFNATLNSVFDCT